RSRILISLFFFFFYDDAATTVIYTLSYTTLFRSQLFLDVLDRGLADIDCTRHMPHLFGQLQAKRIYIGDHQVASTGVFGNSRGQDRKSTRLNSSHVKISYAVFCLKKKNKH